jgi:hypothetical protein
MVRLNRFPFSSLELKITNKKRKGNYGDRQIAWTAPPRWAFPPSRGSANPIQTRNGGVIMGIDAEQFYFAAELPGSVRKTLTSRN